MLYFIIPIAVVAAVGLLCLNFKIGFMVADLTEKTTGFHVGFYMMTVVGLTAAEVSAGIAIALWWFA